MSTVARGNLGENLVRAHGKRQNWLVGSLRHEGGAGDQMWHKPGQRGRLIEVKTGPNLWQCFRRADRIALIARADEFDLDPLLAHVPHPGAKEPQVLFLTVDQWP
jgi:hypothetical protein